MRKYERGRMPRLCGRKGSVSHYYKCIREGKIKIKPLLLSREEMLRMKDKIMRDLENGYD